MEYGLRHFHKYSEAYEVLILVVMEYGLRPHDRPINRHYRVLILVVMEYGLRLLQNMKLSLEES